MIKVRAHTCYLGKTGFAAHSRGFFRELSKHVDLRVRNFTWDDKPDYLNEVDESIIDTITLSNNDGSHTDYPISHSFPNYNWHHSHEEDFAPDVDIVLMDMHHHYFYEDHQASVKIAYTVWESTELEEDFFQTLLTRFDYLWVVTEWHRQKAILQGYPAHRVFVVHEGVDAEFCHDADTNSKYDDGRFKFLFFGRWDYRKAVPEILQTFLKTFNKKEKVDLILSADNPYSVDGMNSTEERLKHYKLTDPRIKVKHFVKRKDYISYIKKGHVLLTCARSEGWNIPLIEAMAAGTPALYSNWGAQLEFAEGKGIPVKIATELPANIGADLGFAGNTPGLYAEADYEDLGNQMRSAYDNYEAHKQKAISDREIIRTEFSWEAAGLSGLKALLAVSSIDLPEPHQAEAVVVMSHADNYDKISLLSKSIITLKRQGYPVILSSHIPVPDSVLGIVDYFVYDKDNPVVYSDEYAKFSSTVQVHYMHYPDIRLNYIAEFNHGYAALKLIKNGLGVAIQNAYKNVHFVNYDYLINDPVVLQSHTTSLETDAGLVSYKWDAEESLNSGLFSACADALANALRPYNSKELYFSDDNKKHALLEDFLYAVCNKANIKMDLRNNQKIGNGNLINAIWLPTMPIVKTKNGSFSFAYLAKENKTGKYIFVGFGDHEEPLHFTIRYNDEEIKHIADPKIQHFTLLEIPEGMVQNGFEVFLPTQKETRRYDNKTHLGTCDVKNWDSVSKLNLTPTSVDIEINFNSGPFVEITGTGNLQYQVEFIDSQTGKMEYTTKVGTNCWARCNQRYYKEWTINVIDLSSGHVTTRNFDLTGQNVLITLESKSLGDSIAWFPHIEEFRQKHKCNVWVSTFKNDLFESNYPGLHFIAPGGGHSIKDLYATYQLGWFYDEDGVNDEFHPRDFRKLSMQATTTDILGLNYSAVRPILSIPDKPRPIKEPYVCIAMHSTAQAKYWNNPTGWQEVTDYWLAKGRKVVMLSLEEDGYMGNFYPKGVTTISGNLTLENTMSYLKHCEMFVGISSGLSWLSWAIDTPTVIISGFSTPITEPMGENVIRIFKGGVCNGCFNRHRLDAGDWNWCPDQKGTDRQFECSRSMTGKEVINAIEDYYEKGKAEKSVEVIVQESYELGMVQNHKEILGASEFFKTLNVHNFMEIGTDQGGSFAIWSKLSTDGIRISVDLPHGAFGRSDYDEYKRDAYLRSLGSNVHMYWGDSHDPQMLKVVEYKLNGLLLDFMFIDGDHTYEGVKADYEMYKHLVKPGGWIAFHDIKDTEFHRNLNCRVDQLWHELDGNKHEFVDGSSPYGGIGFIQVDSNDYK